MNDDETTEPWMPEPGRQVAFVLADALTTWDEDAGPEVNVPAVNLVWRRLSEIDGAVAARIDDETDVVDIDLSNVLGGTLVAMNWLTANLAAATGRQRLDVIADLREFLSQESD